MLRMCHKTQIGRLLLCLGLTLALHADGQTTNSLQRVVDQYQGRTFLLRGFYSDDQLQYDPAGSIEGKANPGDWTSDGFVTISSVQISQQGLSIQAKRLFASFEGSTFRLREPLLKDRDGKHTKPVIVEIDMRLGSLNASFDIIQGGLSKVFLTSADDFSTLIPDYWQSCIKPRMGAEIRCAFSDEMLAVPGFSPTATNNVAPLNGSTAPIGRIFTVGNGVSPPKPLYQADPEYSTRGRQGRCEGAITVAMVVDTQGSPARLKIVNPRGCGLDAKAVEAVRNWKFEPAKKDGEPVPVQIMVEVDFHLY